MMLLMLAIAVSAVSRSPVRKRVALLVPGVLRAYDHGSFVRTFAEQLETATDGYVDTFLCVLDP